MYTFNIDLTISGLNQNVIKISEQSTGLYIKSTGETIDEAKDNMTAKLEELILDLEQIKTDYL